MTPRARREALEGYLGILPWLIGVGIAASLICLALTVYLGNASRHEATSRATRRMTAQANAFARQIEADAVLFDLALREAALSRDAGQMPRLRLLDSTRWRPRGSSSRWG